MAIRFLRLAAAFAAATVGSAAAQQGGDATRTAQGDWTIICERGGANCAMEQLGKDAAGKTVLAIRIEKIDQPGTINGERIDIVADILTPLGTVLSEGLALKIDDGPEQRSPFFICQANGCVVRAPLPKALLDQMRRGKMATFTFAGLEAGQLRRVSTPISLTGFTRSIESLK